MASDWENANGGPVRDGQTPAHIPNGFEAVMPTVVVLDRFEGAAFRLRRELERNLPLAYDATAWDRFVAGILRREFGVDRAEIKRLQDEFARLAGTDYEERVADLLKQASAADAELVSLRKTAQLCTQNGKEICRMRTKIKRLRAVMADVADGLQHDELRGATTDTTPAEWQAVHDEACSRCMLLAALRQEGGG